VEDVNVCHYFQLHVGLGPPRLNEEQRRFLSLLGQLPARLTAEQVAWVLNCQPHDVPILVAARRLKPLGNPPPNSVNFFAFGQEAQAVGGVIDKKGVCPVGRLLFSCRLCRILLEGKGSVLSATHQKRRDASGWLWSNDWASKSTTTDHDRSTRSRGFDEAIRKRDGRE
jgi:hypothetical protein